jgi:gamma-glutamyl hydrolase
LEAAGARVVPLDFTTPLPTLQATLKNINGALFTGGGADFVTSTGSLTPFALAAQTIFNESVNSWAAGEPWPLWGTCLGHELISFLAAGPNINILSAPFDSENLTLPLNFTAAASTSRLYGTFPSNVMNAFATQPITMNNHQAGISPADFSANPNISSRFTVLATNLDRNNKAFVSSMEGNGGLPIFTTQYHPEKVQFEWWSQEVINHSFDSVMSNHYLALQFVNQTRSNTRSFPSPEAEEAALIYNYSPVFTAPTDPSFEQCYFF